MMRTSVSSLRIVPVPVPFAIVAFVGPESTTEKVSCASTLVSPMTST